MNISPLISLEDVSCTYHMRASRFRFSTYEVLSGVNLTVHEGETLGLLGVNGAGKSSLLRIIAGVFAPSQGRVIMHRPCRVSILTLGAGFSEALTGKDNAILGMMMLGHTRDYAIKHLPKIEEFSELGKWMQQPVRTFSTGMRSRLAFAVALEVEADLLLIDEILSVGDANFQMKSAAALKQKILSGCSAVLVSHSEDSIVEFCTKAIFIQSGNIETIGDVETVLAHYRSFRKASVR